MNVELLDLIYCAADIPNAVAAVICGALCVTGARSRDGRRAFFLLLGGFYACAFMCGAFFVLTWLFIDYPYYISPGHLSWAGAMFFLFTADVGLTDSWPDEIKRAAKKYKSAALAGPAVCACFNAAFIYIYPDITANYILFFIPTAMLSYHALYGLLAELRAGAPKGMAGYRITILVWISLQLLHDLFSVFGWSYGYAAQITVFSLLTICATPFIYLQAKRGRFG